MSAPLTQAAKKFLAPEIRKHGFAAIPGPWLSFGRRLPDERRQFVHLEHPAYMNVFTVTLQEAGADGSRRERMLEEFVGLRDYSYGSGTAEEMRRALLEAAGHFDRYAAAWFEDPAFTTPATDTVSSLVRDANHEIHIQRGREAFKRADYASALDEFQKAEALKPLDPTSRKFRDIARKR